MTSKALAQQPGAPNLAKASCQPPKPAIVTLAGGLGLPGQLKRTRLRFWYAGVALGVALLVALAGLFVAYDYQQELTRRQEQLTSLSRLILEHGERAIEDGDKVLKAISGPLIGWDQHDEARPDISLKAYGGSCRAARRSRPSGSVRPMA